MWMSAFSQHRKRASHWPSIGREGSNPAVVRRLSISAAQTSATPTSPGPNSTGPNLIVPSTHLARCRPEEESEPPDELVPGLMAGKRRAWTNGQDLSPGSRRDTAAPALAIHPPAVGACGLMLAKVPP